MFPRDIVCLRNISINTLHKVVNDDDDGGGDDDDDDDDDDDNNNYKGKLVTVTRLG